MKIHDLHQFIEQKGWYKPEQLLSLVEDGTVELVMKADGQSLVLFRHTYDATFVVREAHESQSDGITGLLAAVFEFFITAAGRDDEFIRWDGSAYDDMTSDIELSFRFTDEVRLRAATDHDALRFEFFGALWALGEQPLWVINRLLGVAGNIKQE